MRSRKRNEPTSNSRSLKSFHVVVSKSYQDTRSTSVPSTSSTIDVIEREARTKKEQSASVWKDVRLEPVGLCPRKDESGASTVKSHPFKPDVEVGAVGRVQPDPAVPRLQKSVVLDRKVLNSSRPRADDRRTRVEVERT